MKNLKRALSLVLSTAMMVGMMVVGTGATFTDVAESDHKEAIEVMSMVGIMKGVSETEFAPEADVTRDQMAVIMCNLLDLKLNGTHPFTDVADWADDYVGAIYVNGYTAGKTATTYGGSDKITTAEAALMIMKTLGYFEYQGEFGEDWFMATVKRATELQLFNDIDAGVKETLNRGEVAQMVLNALDESVVLMEEIGGLNVSGDGFSVTEKARYYPNPILCDKHNKAHTVDLAEKLFGDTLSHNDNAYDDFGRPATKWTYTGGAKIETVTVADAPAFVFTAEMDADDMTKALKGYDIDPVNPIVDGVSVEARPAAEEEIDYRVFLDSAAEYATMTGNGVRVELFADKDKDITDMVVINEYVGKITLVNKADEEKDIKRSVVVDGMTYETEDFARKDMVIYTVAGTKIQSMELAESVVGEVTAVADTYIKIDGVSYKFNKQFVGIEPGTGDEVKVYVDSYGYLLEEGDYTKAAAAVSEYLVITSVGNPDAWNDVLVKVLYADGTTGTLLVHPEQEETIEPGLYTYEKTDDGYKFTAPEMGTDGDDADTKVAGYDVSAVAGDYNKDKGTLNGWAIKDDAVFFVNKGEGKFAVATGAELKKADAVSVNVVYANKATTGFNGIEFGYVNSELEGNTDVLYGYAIDETQTIKNTDKVLVDYVTFWNGTEMDYAQASASGDTGIEKKSFFSYELNADGEIDVETIAFYGVGAVEAVDVAGEKIVINGTEYKLTEDSVIMYVDSDKVAGYTEGEIEIADKEIDAETGAEGAYINNVRFGFKTNTDNSVEITVLFVDINNLMK